MKLVAFVRNLNVGQAGFPSRLQLEQAFLAAGALRAVSFQSNGTVVAEVEDGMRPELVRDGAGEYLRAECGFGEAIFVRELEAIRAAVRADPYGGIDASGIDVAGIDAAGIDASGLDAAGIDASGLDAPGIDAPGIDSTEYPHRYVSFYEFPGSVEGVFPLKSGKGDCLVFRGTGQEAYSVAKEIRGVSGYPTPLLEKRLEVPVTTRSWTTLVRLVSKF